MLRSRIVLVAPVVVLLAGVMSVSASDTGPAPRRAVPRVDPEVRAAIQRAGSAPVILVLRDNPPVSSPRHVAAATTADGQAAVLEDLDASEFEVTHRYRFIASLGGELTEAGLAKLEDRADVEAIQLARQEVLHLTEAVGVVRGSQAHDWYEYTGEGVTVAVLDTGIDNTHPDLKDDIVAEKCFAGNASCGGQNESDDAADITCSGHGSHVAGIITSDGRVSAKGIAPDAGIAAVRVFMDRCPRQPTADNRDINAGLEWVEDNRTRYNIKAVNMSLGGGMYRSVCDNQDAARSRIVNRLHQRGIAIFVSSGNDGATNGMSAPACLRNSISVAATWDDEFERAPEQGGFGASRCHDEDTTTETITCFSNVSNLLDIAAPGGFMAAPKVGGGVATMQGTSQASPMAAGLAALMFQADRTLRPNDVERIMKLTGVESWRPRTPYRVPRIDALAAIEALVPATVTPQPTPTPSLTPTVTPTPTITPDWTATPTPRWPEPTIFLPLSMKRHWRGR